MCSGKINLYIFLFLNVSRKGASGEVKAELGLMNQWGHKWQGCFDQLDITKRFYVKAIRPSHSILISRTAIFLVSDVIYILPDSVNTVSFVKPEFIK